MGLLEVLVVIRWLLVVRGKMEKLTRICSLELNKGNADLIEIMFIARPNRFMESIVRIRVEKPCNNIVKQYPFLITLCLIYHLIVFQKLQS